MNTFIEKNERFLRLCSSVARSLGLLIIASVVLILIPVIPWNGWCVSEFVTIILEVVLGRIFLAFLLLGIEQLIKCLVVPEHKPNWILKFGDKIMYIYASFLLINFVYSSLYTREMLYSSGDELSFVVNTLVPSALFTFIKILTWIGIGLLLKRIVPIIQESKSLV